MYKHNFEVVFYKILISFYKNLISFFTHWYIINVAKTSIKIILILAPISLYKGIEINNVGNPINEVIKYILDNFLCRPKLII